MREFFRGWRRKVGCVLLVLACFLAIAWVRSITIAEVVAIGFTDTVLLSHEGRILWWQNWGASNLPFWSQGAARDNSDQVEYYNVLTNLKVGQSGIYACGFPIEDAWGSPYWLILWLLTLLSAYLILWTPRKRMAESDA